MFTFAHLLSYFNETGDQKAKDVAGDKHFNLISGQFIS